MEKKGNSLSTQSKEWILQALLELMDKKNYRSITIKEIAERAGLDRKTFYRNFDTKEDVLRFYLDNALKEYVGALADEHSPTRHTAAKLYYSICNKHIDFLGKLEKNDLLIFLLSIFEEYLPIIHKEFEAQKSVNNPLFYSNYAVSYRIGGFWYITAKWIREGATETPDEMAQIVEALLSKGL